MIRQTMTNSRLQTVWADSPLLIEEAMALRYRVFNLEFRNNEKKLIQSSQILRQMSMTTIVSIC